jgi:hypothetical protein
MASSLFKSRLECPANDCASRGQTRLSIINGIPLARSRRSLLATAGRLQSMVADRPEAVLGVE